MVNTAPVHGRRPSAGFGEQLGSLVEMRVQRCPRLGGSSRKMCTVVQKVRANASSGQNDRGAEEPRNVTPLP